MKDRNNLKLKHYRDYEKNCKEVEDDYLWFMNKALPVMIIATTIISLVLIKLVATYGEEIDNFLK